MRDFPERRDVSAAESKNYTKEPKKKKGISKKSAVDKAFKY